MAFHCLVLLCAEMFELGRESKRTVLSKVYINN